MDSTLKDEKNGNGEFKDIHDDVPVLRLKQHARQDEFEVKLQNHFTFLDENTVVNWNTVLCETTSKLDEMRKGQFEIALYGIVFECERARREITENAIKCIKAANKGHQIEREKMKLCLAQQTVEESLEETKKSQDDTSQENQINVQDEYPIEKWIERLSEIASKFEFMTRMGPSVNISEIMIQLNVTKRKMREDVTKCITAANEDLEMEIKMLKMVKVYLRRLCAELAQQTIEMLEEKEKEKRKLEDVQKISKLQLRLKEKKEQTRQLAAIVNSKKASMEKEELELKSYQREIMEIEAEIEKMKNLELQANHRLQVERAQERAKQLEENTILSEHRKIKEKFDKEKDTLISKMVKVGEILGKRIGERKLRVYILNNEKEVLIEVIDTMQDQPDEPEIASNSLLTETIPKPTEECHAGSSQAAKNFHYMKDLESEKATPTPSGERKEPTKNLFDKQ